MNDMVTHNHPQYDKILISIHCGFKACDIFISPDVYAGSPGPMLSATECKIFLSLKANKLCLRIGIRFWIQRDHQPRVEGRTDN